MRGVTGIVAAPAETVSVTGILPEVEKRPVKKRLDGLFAVGLTGGKANWL
jgi:hypothetical protein